MIAGMTYYQICWYFILYSFFGWCLEVAFHGVTLGKVVNRGFLNGPVCPVYGFGMLAVLAIGNVAENALKTSDMSIMSGSDPYGTLMLFAGGVVLATAVELVAGWVLDKLFHTRWWDYSDKPLNFHGYICLEFSLLWGLGVVLVVRILQPILETHSAASMIPEKYGWPILLVLYLIFLTDLIVTVATITGLNKRIARIEKMRSSMRVLSDGLSEAIGGTATVTTQRLQEGQVQASLAKAEFRDAAQAKRSQMEENAALRKARTEAKAAAAREEYEKAMRELRESRTLRRLGRAFPRMQHHRNVDAWRELRSLKKTESGG